MLRIKTSIAIVLLALLAGCRGEEKAAEPEAQNEVSVEIAPVAKSDIQLKVAADAILYPLQQAAIVPKLTAPVKKFYVQRGDRVKAGQLLAELENRDLASAAMESKAAAEQAEAAYQTTARAAVPEELQKAELDVRAAKDTLDAQQKIFEARQDLYKQGAIAQKDVNEAQVNLTNARNQYEIARKHLEDLQSFTKDQEIKSAAAQRDAAQARHETSQVQLAYSRIVSPIDGVVTDRPLFAGETPQSGAPLITVMDVSSVIARAHFAIEQAAQLKVGNSANLIISGAEPVPAKVTQISPALDPASTTVEVWVQAANPRGQLKPGSSVRVEAIAKTAADALVIPYSAVLTDTETGHTSVIVANAENKPQRKEVSLGIREGDQVQVLEGLNDGERVVTAGAFELGKLEDDVLKNTTLKIATTKEEPDEK